MDRRVLISDSDPVRTYTTDEEQRLTRNLVKLLSDVHSGHYSDRAFDVSLLCEFHFTIFQSVRRHAGRCRSPATGSEYLTFGPHRSPPRDEVPEALAHVLEESGKGIKSIEQNPDDPDYEVAALRIAVWAHAEIIRIHPFEDGNGRTARAFLNAILVRLHLRPIIFEAPKQEYLALLNDYFKRGSPQLLLDFCILLYHRP